jgi:hypothetical protein
MLGAGFLPWGWQQDVGRNLLERFCPWLSWRKNLFVGIRVSGSPRKSEDFSKISFIPIGSSWERIILNTFEKLWLSVYSEILISLLFFPLTLD